MKNKLGFTVIEIIVVIGIIAILTVIVFPSISNIRAKNRDTERVADIAAIQLALSLYYNKNGVYPEANNLELALVPTFTPADSLTPPNEDEDYQYVYVPLKRGSDKCTFYHLGVRLELSSSQIDSGNTFSTKTNEISNGYSYCGDYDGDGIPNYNGDKEIYSVHP